MDTNKKFERVVKYDITKTQVEGYLGPITDKQFELFCEKFDETFLLHYNMVFDLLKEDWEDFKPEHWDVY